MILPGESLAKYRGRDTEPPTPQEQSPFDEGPIVEDLEPVAVQPEPPAEDIETPRADALDAAAEAPAETVAEVLDEPLAEISVETIQVIVETAEAAPDIRGRGCPAVHRRFSRRNARGVSGGVFSERGRTGRNRRRGGRCGDRDAEAEGEDR